MTSRRRRWSSPGAASCPGSEFPQPLSVITGAAGTGKSTLLAPLIAAIRKYEGMVPIRALTPTGKAADRLEDSGVDAMTIHRALASAGWYDWELGVWVEGDDRVVADTSSSMSARWSTWSCWPRSLAPSTGKGCAGWSSWETSSAPPLGPGVPSST